MSNSDDDDVDEYIEVDDGCGCAEVWEELSARRRDGTTATDAAADD